VFGAGAQHRGDLAGGAVGNQDGVRRAGEVARAQAHQVGVAATGGVGHARLQVDAQRLRRGGGHQGRVRLGAQLRRHQLGFVQRHGLAPDLGGFAELLAQQVLGGRRQLGVVPVLTPAPPAH
jgi:hypothetical protein